MFDALYDTVIRQVSYIMKSPNLSCNMVSLHTLIKDSINVLIGVPSGTFHLDKVYVVNWEIVLLVAYRVCILIL